MKSKLVFLLIILGVLLTAAVVITNAERAILRDRNVMMVNMEERCALNGTPATSAQPRTWTVYKIGDGLPHRVIWTGGDFNMGLYVLASCGTR